MLLEVEGLCVNYGRIEAIRDITFSVEQGEIVTLIGANGAGKTTTLKTLSGLRTVRAGRGRASRARTSPTCRRTSGCQLGISQSPEGRRIFPGMTVVENLDMGAYSRADRAKTRSGGPGAGVRAVPAAARAARTSRPGRCPAASSRCSPSGGR